MKIDNATALLAALIRKDKERIETAFGVCIASEKEGRVKTKLKALFDEYRRREGTVVVENLQPAIRSLITSSYIDKDFEDMVLSQELLDKTIRVIREWEKFDLLLEKGLRPVNRMLLEGPPGNGKTCFVSALSKRLGLPLFCTNSSLLLDSYLGKTEQNVTTLFRFLPERCVIFFDEFESLASERERSDQGTIRAYNSVVTSLLLNLDKLPPSVMFVAATNRSELLDKALLRRFDMQLRFGNPTKDEKRAFVTKYVMGHDLEENKITEDIWQNLENAVSFSDLERILQEWHKDLIMKGE